MNQIITRKEARAKGLKRYFTGKPCKHGHVAERFVSGPCVECAQEYGRNPKNRKRHNERFRERYKNDPEFRNRLAKYQKQNRERLYKIARERYKNNRAKVEAKRNELRLERYRTDPEYRVKIDKELQLFRGSSNPSK